MVSNLREQIYTLAALTTKPSVIMRPIPEPPPYALGGSLVGQYSNKDDFAFYAEERLNVHVFGLVARTGNMVRSPRLLLTKKGDTIERINGVAKRS